MTRLDASNEPSMEDILASIRKIIAEDPPGSRPVPLAPQRVAATPLQQAVFGKTSVSEPAISDAAASIRSASPLQSVGQTVTQTVTQSAASEPYLRTMPSKPEAKAFISAPFFVPRNEYPAARVEPSFARPVSFENTVEAPLVIAESAEANQPSNLTALSVEDQLSDLLDDAALVTPSAATIAHGKTEMSAVQPTKVESNDAVLYAEIKTAAPISEVNPVEPAPAVQAPVNHFPVNHYLDNGRPKFTVSQDGFVPDAVKAGGNSVPEVSNVSGSEAAGAQAVSDADPFNFDLGPSPFRSQAPIEITPVRPPSTTVASESIAPQAAKTLAGVTDPATLVDQPSRIQTRATAAEHISPQEAVFVLPSIAATLLPPSFSVAQPSAAAEAPDVVSFAAASRAEASALDVAPEEPKADVAAAVLQSTIFTSASAALAPSTALLASPAVVEPERASPERTSMTLSDFAAQRSMEDTVADLLRPMLKSWLSENMPKIVERALRREISERLLGEHKTAAE